MASLTIQADKIEATVTKINKDYVTSSQLTQTADSITSKVNAIARDYVTSSELEQTANSIGLKILSDGTVKSSLTLAKNGLEFTGNKAIFSGKLEAASGTFCGDLSAEHIVGFGQLMGKNGRVSITDTDGFIPCIYSPMITDTDGSNSKWCIWPTGVADFKEVSVTDNGNGTSAEAITASGDGKTVYFGNSSQTRTLTSALRGDTVRIYSHNGGAVYLGGSGSTAITSDENLKFLNDIDNKYETFFNNLNPQTYVYKNKGHRKHVGFGARGVEKALLNAGLTTEEFAGVVIDTDVTITADEAGTEEDQHYDDLYYLRYEEFIALNTWMIQKLFKKVKTLEDKVAELERSKT